MICCSLSAVGCWSLAALGLLFVGGNACCLLSGLCLLFAVVCCCMWFVVCCLLFAVCC